MQDAHRLGREGLLNTSRGAHCAPRFVYRDRYSAICNLRDWVYT